MEFIEIRHFSSALIHVGKDFVNWKKRWEKNRILFLDCYIIWNTFSYFYPRTLKNCWAWLCSFVIMSYKYNIRITMRFLVKSSIWVITSNNKLKSTIHRQTIDGSAILLTQYTCRYSEAFDFCDHRSYYEIVKLHDGKGKIIRRSFFWETFLFSPKKKSINGSRCDEKCENFPMKKEKKEFPLISLRHVSNCSNSVGVLFSLNAFIKT